MGVARTRGPAVPSVAKTDVGLVQSVARRWCRAAPTMRMGVPRKIGSPKLGSLRAGRRWFHRMGGVRFAGVGPRFVDEKSLAAAIADGEGFVEKVVNDATAR